MKTQCPNCKKLWFLNAEEKDKTKQCPHCKTEFYAAPYVGPVVDQSIENISRPGLIWYILGAIVGVIGIIIGLFNITRGGLAIIIWAGMFWLVTSAVGGILNRLERIAYHTERFRKEMKSKKSEDY